MNGATIVLAALCVALLGLTVWLLLERARLAAGRAEARRDAEEANARAARLSEESAALGERVSEARAQAARLQERIEGFERSRAEDAERLKTLREAFDASASQALERSNKRFLELAKATFESQQKDAKGELDKRREAVERLVEPISKTLKETSDRLTAIDKARAETAATLSEQLRAHAESRQRLIEETSRLQQALRKPQVRGRYGEIQLQRVAELAGMTAYCDFDTQASVRSSDGRSLRPDMVVRLPNDRVVVVDAKTNIEPYLDALEAESSDQQEQHLERFAAGVLDQARRLAGKDYWAEFRGSPEFVVMFVPGDQFVDAALERRPDLLEDIASHKVILASPSTLIGLLRAVHVGWREKQLSDSARELFEIGRELHERAAIVYEHIGKVGLHIGRSAKAFNDLVGSVDHRLTPTLEKFERGGARSAKTIESPGEIDVATRALRAAETPLNGSDAPDRSSE